MLVQSNDEISLTWSSFYRHVLSNNDSRNLAIQLSMNFSFMFVELIYGYISNSLGLITDSLHMLIDSSALIIALYASFMSKQKPNRKFTFGYERVEVLSGYANGVFLLYAVIEIISESFERLAEPQKVFPEKMIVVSFIGLLVNLIGLYFFHGHAHMHSEDSSGCQHEHNHNLSGVYLHILADALGSIACIISAIVIYYYEFYLADPITSIIISLLILTTTVQLLTSTTKVLLLHLPLTPRKILSKIKADLAKNQIEYISIHLWQFKEQKYVFMAQFKYPPQDRKRVQLQIEQIIKHPYIIQQAIDFV